MPDDLPELEDFFGVNVMIYTQTEIDEPARLVYHSCRKHGGDTLYLHAANHHLSLIMDIASYNKAFICNICEKIFPRLAA